MSCRNILAEVYEQRKAKVWKPQPAVTYVVVVANNWNGRAKEVTLITVINLSHLLRMLFNNERTPAVSSCFVSQ